MFAHFNAADKDYDGLVKFDDFDNLIEAAAAKVRRLGLAPPTSEMYKNDVERLAARKKVFAEMNVSGSGAITLMN
eukprot:UN14707